MFSLLSPPLRRLLPSTTRSYLAVHLAQFSPSHEKSRNLVWQKKVGDKVNIYDHLYDVTAYDLSPENPPGTATEMLLECVDDGYLTHVFFDFPEGNIEANEVVGVLSKDIEEHSRLTALIESLPEKDRNAPTSVLLKIDFPSNTIMWEGFLATEGLPPSPGNIAAPPGLPYTAGKS